MGKKSGKKGKKKGKGKKNAEPQMTWKEALLAYQINIKERQLEDALYEQKAIEEQHTRHKERNQRLQAEQMYYMKTLLAEANYFDKRLQEKMPIEKHDVITVMKNKWEVKHNEEESISEHKSRITDKEKEIINQEREVTYWNQYRDYGANEHSKQIELLKQELHDMQSSHDEMAAHLHKALEKCKIEIEESTGETVSRQKYLASEKAMAKMDKSSRQEVLDNDWLKREVKIHRREADNLMQKVETLERENLQVMAELFECAIDDLKISRKFFLTQFEEPENLEETGILEIDLNCLAINNLSDHIPEKVLSPKGRPKSATQKYVEDKVFSLTATPERIYEPKETVADSDSHYGGKYEPSSDDEDPFNNYFQFENEDFEDYLQLGPLELKLLNVTGTKMKIHEKVILTDEEEGGIDFTTNQYPKMRLKAT